MPGSSGQPGCAQCLNRATCELSSCASAARPSMLSRAWAIPRATSPVDWATPEMCPAICSDPLAASVMLRPDSLVVAVCSSTAEAIVSW